MEIGPGAEIAGFRLEELIGEGGMGVVYRARQLDLDRSVALKLIAAERREDDEFKQRFKRESKLAASIDHPNVVPIYGAGEANGHFYIAMRYVGGTDLSELLRRSAPLAPARASEIVSDVAAGLDAAHAAGLVHRDVKPANVLIDERDHVYLTDFGITKQIGSETQKTKTGLWYGALPYAAPEQIENSAVTARTDIYALGCVLFEALTAKRPYERDSDMAVMWGKVHEEPATASDLRPSLPREFDAVLDRAISRDPTDRYASAGDLGRAAVAAVSGREVDDPERTVARGAAASTATLPLQTPKASSHGSGRRPRWLIPALGTLGAVAIGALVAVALSAGGGGDGKAEVRTLSKTVTESAPGPEAASGSIDNEEPASASSVEEPELEQTSGDFGYARIPVGWFPEKEDERIGERSESQWRNPEDSNTSVLIDSQFHSGSTTAMEDAENVRGEASQSAGYREISLELVELEGIPAARWVFEVEDDRRVDYFFINCEVGYAVLGSTSPEDFNSWDDTFHRVAASIEPFCD